YAPAGEHADQQDGATGAYDPEAHGRPQKEGKGRVQQDGRVSCGRLGGHEGEHTDAGEQHRQQEGLEDATRANGMAGGCRPHPAAGRTSGTTVTTANVLVRARTTGVNQYPVSSWRRASRPLWRKLVVIPARRPARIRPTAVRVRSIRAMPVRKRSSA